MWGTRKTVYSPNRLKRFIPTHVGNTSPELEPCWVSSVHPHACGEHLLNSHRICSGFGSSPRMWGTLPHSICNSLGIRFIPTHVGNTKQFRRHFILSPVHPHACGEHRERRRQGRGSGGSSPRMWGTPQFRAVLVHGLRFIPTHVGNTSPYSRGCIRWAVHPHACGEHPIGIRANRILFGSSPRMWGTRL